MLDLATVKQRQQQTWATGDFSVMATPLYPTAEVLCDDVAVASGSQVLDVACGSGNAAISGMGSTGMMDIATSGNSAIRILGNGDIGFGTVVPTDPLHVRRDRNEQTAILVQNNTSDTAAEALTTRLRRRQTEIRAVRKFAGL